MLRILIIEDDQPKLMRVTNSLKAVAGISLDNIDHVVDARGAKLKLADHFFDVVLVDIAIPSKIDEEVGNYVGLKLINEILDREAVYKMPTHIVAITAFPEILKQVSDEISHRLIPFLYCNMASDVWEKQLHSFMQRAVTAKRCLGMSGTDDYGSHLAIVCALESIELYAVLHNGWEWHRLPSSNDATTYYQTLVEKDGQSKWCYAAAAPRKGMPASAVLASKMIAAFRPQYVAMAGITAGYAGKTKYGDVIIADPVWDWGSGKLKSQGEKPVFEPEPHQLDLDVDIRNRLKLMAEDVTALSRIRSEWRGEKPDHELSVHIGPAASGAAVLADEKTHQRILQQHRGILGIEMETYAVFCAVQESPMPRPSAFSMKAVVDFADAKKGDDYRNYAAYTSAQVLKLFVENYL